jgi:hypothetical protein
VIASLSTTGRPFPPVIPTARSVDLIVTASAASPYPALRATPDQVRGRLFSPWEKEKRSKNIAFISLSHGERVPEGRVRGGDGKVVR